MVDKVKPLKIENITDGTENDLVYTETDPTEDYLAAKGLSLENTDTHLINIQSTEMAFTDPTSGTIKLSQTRDAIKFQSIPVDTTTPTNNQVLVYKSSVGKYVPSINYASIPSSVTPPSDPQNGDPWYNPNTKSLYNYDTSRGKWLTAPVGPFVFSYDSSIDGAYLKVGVVNDSRCGFPMRSPATITSIYCTSVTGNQTKGIELRDGAQSDGVVFNFSLSSGKYINKNTNINLNEDAILKAFITDVGQPTFGILCILEIAWRYQEP